jgi:putative Mg2+ transporter-C (MgtC) family protein
MTLSEIFLRLFSATIIGGAIGLNRDLHGKSTGVRTLGLVSLGSALIVMGVIDFATPAIQDMNPLSRVVQGVLTGIGFLGAGVILHDSNVEHRIHGLTTAAVTWLTACVGLICGIGNWKLLLVGVSLLFLLLLLGGKIEELFHHPAVPDDDAPLKNKSGE